MAHQSLYRRYRPRRFADVRGQDHVVKALRNAVAQGSEGHAYLFSGPRGTGKTSTARILAKALNCPNLTDGEPCGECESCLSIEQGSSYDLFELDAASNNGVDAMRELISRTVVGSPGRNKVYILDEVHMLSPAASNALLKTLEEPPEHVCFVLATTDPQKVLPTIRSRTQHFEFSLLSATELADYVRWIRDDAGLTFDEAAVEHVVRQGRGSARDTLSALDMVVAAGGVNDRPESLEEILRALVDRDTARVMTAVADAVAQGREPRILAEQLLVSLRDAFLASVHAQLDHLSDNDQAQMAELSSALGTATITRALESLGLAIVDMRQAADPRVPLEVALIRLTTPAADTSVQSLVERIEDLERRLARGVPAPASSAAPAPAAPAPSAPAPSAPAPSAPVADTPTASAEPAPAPGSASSPAEIRAQLAARKGETPSASPRPAPPKPPGRPAAPQRPGAPEALVAGTPASAPAEPAAAPSRAAAESTRPEDPAPAAAPPSGEAPSVEAVAAALTESVIPTLSGMTKSLYNGGHFVGGADGTYRFALDNVPDRVLPRAEAALADVEAALSARLGRPISIVLSNGADEAPAAGGGTPGGASSAAAATPATDDADEHDHIDVSELEDATDAATSGVDKLVQAFPGAELIEQETP